MTLNDVRPATLDLERRMNANPVIKTIYKNVFGDSSLDTKEEQKLQLAIVKDSVNINIIDTVTALFERGPLFDGDVPSKSERDWLLENDYCEKVVVKGEDGYNACTHKGAWLYRCQRELYKRFNQSEAA